MRWHPDAAAERSAAWPDEEKVAMSHAVEKLEAVGPRLPFPHSSAVRGSSGQGLRELRPRAGRSRWRLLYRQIGTEAFVVLAVAPEAKIDAAGFGAAVERAVMRHAGMERE